MAGFADVAGGGRGRGGDQPSHYGPNPNNRLVQFLGNEAHGTNEPIDDFWPVDEYDPDEHIDKRMRYSHCMVYHDPRE